MKKLISCAAVAFAALAFSHTPDADAAERQAAAPLSVTLNCDPMICEAWADGGTGVYSFSWENASEQGEHGAFSSADPYCLPGSGPGAWYTYVRVTVTDSSGATATTFPYPLDCRFGGIAG